jgi:hypothetical protein
MTDREIGEALCRSSEAIQNDPDERRLVTLLRERYGDIQAVYLVQHIPEQGQDIYTLHVRPEIVTIVELSRVSLTEPAIVEEISFQSYCKQLRTKETRRKLMAAKRLLEVAGRHVQRRGRTP